MITKIKLTVYVVGIIGLGVLVLPGLVFASSCHGGEDKSQHRGPEEYQTKGEKDSSLFEIIEINPPPKVTIKGTLTCPGDFLHRNRKGYWHVDKKCKNSAIIVEKVVECDRSGMDECPYENKLYHILFDENSKKLLKNKKYQNAKVYIIGRFYLDERAVEVVSFRLLSEEEIKDLESHVE